MSYMYPVSFFLCVTLGAQASRWVDNVGHVKSFFSSSMEVFVAVIFPVVFAFHNCFFFGRKSG